MDISTLSCAYINVKLEIIFPCNKILMMMENVTIQILIVTFFWCDRKLIYIRIWLSSQLRWRWTQRMWFSVFEGTLAKELTEYGTDPGNCEIEIPAAIVEVAMGHWTRNLMIHLKSVIMNIIDFWKEFLSRKKHQSQLDKNEFL